MRNVIAAFSLTLALSALAACGFTPVHGTSLSAVGSSDIQINEMPGRSGYELRKALQQELATGLPGVSDGAMLEIDLDDNLSRIPLNPDGAASRSDLRLRARYVLSFGEQSVNGTVLAESSFNVPDQPFGDFSAQIAAQERAAKLLAQKLATDLRIKLSAQEAG